MVEGNLPSGEKVEHDDHRIVGDDGAYVVDLHRLGSRDGDIKTAADGCTVLIPQPTTDPNDPLNWPTFKKNLGLFVLSVVAFMPDFESSLSIVTLLPQAK